MCKNCCLPLDHTTSLAHKGLAVPRGLVTNQIKYSLFSLGKFTYKCRTNIIQIAHTELLGGGKCRKEKLCQI
jgi:hypothetical protein